MMRRNQTLLTGGSPCKDEEVIRQVYLHLGWLDYGALYRAAQVTLRSMGYKEMRIAANMHGRGRSRAGGFTLIGWLPKGHEKQLTLIQVRRRERGQSVQRVSLDSLRSAMSLMGASRGIAITSGDFARAAVDTNRLHPGRPVQLIDGRHFARLMVRHGLGVRTKPLPMGELPELVIDELFFERLEELGRK